MRHTLRAIVIGITLIQGGAAARVAAASDGSDGPFHPTTNVTLTPPADGIFHFTTIAIPAHVTVRFDRNAANTPVVLTATGDVEIDGAIDVSAPGYGYQLGARLGGPGAGDGGLRGSGGAAGSTGTGPSPGIGGSTIKSAGGGGGLATEGGIAVRHSVNPPSTGGGAVSFPAPLVGGSGGGGGGGNLFFGVPLDGGHGGGGGGAVRIETPGRIAVSGTILANGAWGGDGYAIGPAGPGGGGSGGVIDLAADEIEIDARARVEARGGPGGGIGSLPVWHPDFSCEADGGLGFVRLTGATRVVFRLQDAPAVLLVDTPLFEGPTEHFYCHKTRNSPGSLCAAVSPVNAGAPCEDEEDCGGSSSGSPTDLCRANKLAAGLGVSLADAVAPAERIAEVRKPLGLCAPTDKNGEGIGDPDHSLRAYQIALTKGVCAAGAPANAGEGCKGESDCGGARGSTSFCVVQAEPTPRGVSVENQFHVAGSPLTLDLGRLERLLVPTRASLVAPPSPPGATGPGHFACYRASVPRSAPPFVPIAGVTLADALNPDVRTVDLRKPTRLCAPADKNGEGIRDPDTWLLCYRAALVKRLCAATAPLAAGKVCRREEDCGGIRGTTGYCGAQPKHTAVLGLLLGNQFGPERVDTVKEEELCVPSLVDLP